MTKPIIHTAITLEELLELPYNTVKDALLTGEITEELGLMRFGSNYTFLVELHTQDTRFLAVYKPRMGERPLWDFGDGTLCQREVAACVLSEALGWYLVPPTTLTEGSERGVGSLQVFIEHDPERHYFTFDETHIPQLKKLALFDVIANNADRKGGHCILDSLDRIWGIDQGLCFNHAPKLRTVIWDFVAQPIDEEHLTTLGTLCDQLETPLHATAQALSELLDPTEMTALKRRIDKLLRVKHYPSPGAGAARPWPPV